ncbi:MAG: PaaI family thioesterase [Alphaproteobacteria bacterium]|nr:PaaI family thioesterase [Alphaproteobacteria bacterium]
MTGEALPLARRVELTRTFLSYVPHNNALGIELGELGDGVCTMRLPWAEHLVGDPTTGILHGGAITALLDAACGGAVFLALRQPVPLATLDLRIDYLRAALPRHDIVARGTVLRVARSVAFARCEAAHADDPGHVVAIGTGAFMLATRRGEHRVVPEEAP